MDKVYNPVPMMMTTDVFNLDAYSTGKQYETDIYFWK